MSEAIDYRPPPTVRRFMRSSAFVRACVGPLGSGKSSGCVMEILRRATQQAPSPDGVRHTRFAVIRNTQPQLKDTTRKTFEQWIPPDIGRWHEQEFTFEIDRPLADGTRIHCETAGPDMPSASPSTLGPPAASIALAAAVFIR